VTNANLQKRGLLFASLLTVWRLSACEDKGGVTSGNSNSDFFTAQNLNCAFDPIAKEINVDGRLGVCGVLNESFQVEFHRQVDAGNDQILIITSGGMIGYSSAITEISNENNITLFPYGICGSACMYIVENAREVLIDDKILFIQHQQLRERIEYINSAMFNHGDELTSPDISDLTQANEFLAFLQSTNSPVNFLNQVSNGILETKCADGVLNNKLLLSFNGALLISSEYDAWIVPRKFIENSRLRKNLPPLQKIENIGNGEVWNAQVIEEWFSNLKIVTPTDVNLDKALRVNARLLNGAQFCSVEDFK